MRFLIPALLLVVGLGPAAVGCGNGESAEEKAMNQVCDARADIEKQVNEVKALTVSTATVDGIKGNISAIENDLTDIKDAEGQLNEQRKQEVQSATQTFETQVESVAKNLLSSVSLSGAQSQLQSSLQQLAKSYQETLAPIDCS
jgi:hypothetical protein